MLSPNADICDHDFYETLDCPSDDESSIIIVFDSETNQMLELEPLNRLRGNPGLLRARKDAVNWMFKVHCYEVSRIHFVLI